MEAAWWREEDDDKGDPLVRREVNRETLEKDWLETIIGTFG